MSRWRGAHLLGWVLVAALVAAMTLLGWAATALALGTTSQEAFERCGETHLTVRNNTAEPVHVAMFGQYKLLEPFGSAVLWTDEEVTVDRVTRRRGDQEYHTSTTSTFSTEERPCTYEWSTL